MILNKEIVHEAEYAGDIQENKVGIDLKNIDFITSLLTSNLYSKPVESFFRETVSNAYDSHVEAGTEDPILILIDGSNASSSGYQVSIRDYGTGLSPERFDLIYRNIGSSTKRDSNDFIGMFGIGRFAALSCADEATVTSYYNGTKYSYIMYKNGRGINIDKISETKGDYKNGLEVSVCIKTSYFSMRDAINQLCFFPNIHVEYSGEYNYVLSSAIPEFNNRTVHEAPGFSTCNILSKSYYRVGNVLYPVDEGTWAGLYGLCLNLEIGSVDITPNREALQFTPRTKDAISKAITVAKKSIADAITFNGDNMSLAAFARTFSNSYRINLVNYNNVEVSYDFIKDCPLEFNVDGEHLDKDFIEFFLCIKGYTVDKDWVYKASFQSKSRYRSSDKDIWSSVLQHPIYLKKDKVFKQVTIDYFQDNVGTGCYVIFKPDMLDIIKTYYTRTFPDVKEEVIDTFIKLIKNNSKTIGNDDVPSSYIASHSTPKVKTDEVKARSYIGTTYSVYELKWILHNNDTGIIIYTQNTNDPHIIEQLGSLCDFKGFFPIKYVITVKKEVIPLLEKDKRFVSLDTFLYGNHKIISKIVTAKCIMDDLPRGCSPLYKRFYKIYKSEVDFIENTYRCKYLIEELCTLYKERGWYNKEDVKRFAPSDKKELFQSIIKAKNLMMADVDGIINRLLIRKYGIVPEVGLVPKQLNISI